MKWKVHKKPFSPQAKEALILQHHAVQFIALVGKYLIKEKADDSHTNMIFVTEKNMFVGNHLNHGLYLAVQATDLYLMLVDENLEIQKQFALEGKSKATIYKMLRKMLSDSGLDIHALKQELHYEIPSHPLDHGALFAFNDSEGFEENNLFRFNAKSILNEVVAPLEKAEDIRVWPHHFDTGCFMPLSYNDQEELSQYIGLGFAIPDTMVDEPYFYLSFWSMEPIQELMNPSALESGLWMMPNWNGGVLTLSEILQAKTAHDQYELVKAFYQSGLNTLMSYLPIK